MPVVSRRHVLLIAALGLFIGLMGFLLTNYWNQIVYALTPRPETFTELYFADHLNLPRRTEFDTLVEVPYTVHNLEYEPMNYTARVTVRFDGVYPLEYIESEETFTLNHDESKTLMAKVNLPAIYAKRAKVSVVLVELNQSIHYWIDVPYLMPIPSPSPSPSVSPELLDVFVE